jgi:hypothetical protein
MYSFRIFECAIFSLFTVSSPTKCRIRSGFVSGVGCELSSGYGHDQCCGSGIRLFFSSGFGINFFRIRDPDLGLIIFLAIMTCSWNRKSKKRVPVVLFLYGTVLLCRIRDRKMFGFGSGIKKIPDPLSAKISYWKLIWVPYKNVSLIFGPTKNSHLKMQNDTFVFSGLFDVWFLFPTSNSRSKRWYICYRVPVLHVHSRTEPQHLRDSMENFSLVQCSYCWIHCYCFSL